MSKPKKTMLQTVLKKRLNMAPTPKASTIAYTLGLLVSEFKKTHPDYDQSEMKKLTDVLEAVNGSAFSQLKVTARNERVREMIDDLMPSLIDAVQRDKPSLSTSLNAINWRLLFGIPPPLPPPGHIRVDPPRHTTTAAVVLFNQALASSLLCSISKLWMVYY